MLVHAARSRLRDIVTERYQWEKKADKNGKNTHSDWILNSAPGFKSTERLSFAQHERSAGFR